MDQKYKTYTFQGLGTTSFKLPADGEYVFEGKSTIPTIINGGGESALVVSINLNGGSALYTSPPSSRTFRQIVNGVAGDTVNMVFSSGNAVDQALNAIKTSISISDGV